MPHRVLGCLVSLLVASALSAAPHLQSVSPSAGFPYGGTTVMLEGTDLVDAFVHCIDRCQTPGPCPVTVLFGATPGVVQYALPDRVVVVAPAHAAGTVDVTLRVNGRNDIKLTNAFTFDPNAVGNFGDYVTYLVPIVVDELAGAHGSLWRSERTVLNATGEVLVMRGVDTATPIAPHEWRDMSIAAPPPGFDGAYVSVPKPLAADVSMELRVRDVSRAAEGWGSEIPIVAQTEFAGAVRLLNVPTDERNRATLRIYGSRETKVRIRTLRQTPAEGLPVEDSVRDLLVPPAGEGLHPLYLQVDPLTPQVRAAASGQPVIIEVFVEDDSIIDPPPSIWAFVTITNNETQQVTTITPQQ